jgi:hypothetical protein
MIFSWLETITSMGGGRLGGFGIELGSHSQPSCVAVARLVLLWLKAQTSASP